MCSSTVTMECQVWPETNTCVCSCNRPKLLHLPCSHIYAARGKAGIAGTYVSPYYLKEAVIATWSGELRGQRALADFTKPPPNGADWIPDPETKIIHRGRRKSHRIRNDMDAKKATGGEKYFLACGGGHLRKDCESYPIHRNTDGTTERRVPQHNSKNNQIQGPLLSRCNIYLLFL